MTRKPTPSSSAPWKLDRYGYPQPDIGPGGRDGDGLSATQRRTIRQRRAIKAGMHPLTQRPLIDQPENDHDRWGYNCGDCAHAFRYRPGNKTVWKCAIAFRAARGSSEATDLRVGWPACNLLRIEQS